MAILSNINFDDIISYCIFPNSYIRNGQIPVHEKVLFEILCSYDFITGDGTRKGWCDPGLQTIADQMGLSKRSVQIYLKRLVQKGLVTVIYRNTALQEKSSLYILNILPGLSENDRKRIAATRTIDIKNKISGLNIIKVQTAQGMQYISEEEFDLEYLVTGHRSSEVIDGEIVDVDDIVEGDTEIEFKDNGDELEKQYAEQCEQEQQESQENEDAGFSFKKPAKPINTNHKKDINSGMYDPDPVVRILSGNYKDLKPMDIIKYFKHKYEIQYPGETLVFDRIKDTRALKLKMAEVDIPLLIQVIDYFIQNYARLFYTNEYRRPRIYQLGIAWIFNKLLENFYYNEKGKQEMNQETVNKDNVKTMTF